MNSNQPSSDPSSRGNAELNDSVLKTLDAYRWRNRALTTVVLGAGLLSIAAGILIAWANVAMIAPMQRLLLQDYPQSMTQTNASSSAAPVPAGKTPLTKAELDWRHVQVTAAHGKSMFLMAASVALLGIGTFVTILLVILNRRVTLRQINASLMQISAQIKELPGGQDLGRSQ